MTNVIVTFGLVMAVLVYAPVAAAHDTGHGHSHAGGIAMTIGHDGFGFHGSGHGWGHRHDRPGHHYKGRHHVQHWASSHRRTGYHYYPRYYGPYVPTYHHDREVHYYCPVCNYRTRVVTTYVSHVHHHHHVPPCHVTQRIEWDPAYSAYVFLGF
jgi:hypothetical protein